MKKISESLFYEFIKDSLNVKIVDEDHVVTKFKTVYIHLFDKRWHYCLGSQPTSVKIEDFNIDFPIYDDTPNYLSEDESRKDVACYFKINNEELFNIKCNIEILKEFINFVERVKRYSFVKIGDVKMINHHASNLRGIIGNYEEYID